MKLLKVKNHLYPGRLVFCMLFAFFMGYISYMCVKGQKEFYISGLPSFAPSWWLLIFAMTFAYFLMGLALYRVWSQGSMDQNVRKAITLCFICLTLNFIWSIIFFGFCSPFFALAAVIMLIIAVTATLFNFYKTDKIAFVVFCVYLSWAVYLLLLNISIVIFD